MGDFSTQAWALRLACGASLSFSHVLLLRAPGIMVLPHRLAEATQSVSGKPSWCLISAGPPPWEQDWLVGARVCDAHPPAQLDPGVLNAQGSPFNTTEGREDPGEEGQFLHQGSGGGMRWCPILGTAPEASTDVKGPWNWV